MGVITWAQGTDIGGGRGRLAEEPAKSLARIDAALGWLLGVNEAWRDPAVADRLYDDYRSGRSSVIALPGDQSIHCRGYAIDTPNSDLVVLLARHGWFQTVYRGGRLVEPWHFEYDPSRDQYRHIEMAKGADGVWRIQQKEWDEMASKQEIGDVVSERIADRRPVVIMWVPNQNGSADCWVSDFGNGTRYNVIRGQVSVEAALEQIQFLKNLGLQELHGLQPPWTIAGLIDITGEGSVREEVAKGIRDAAERRSQS